jgi:hypothetical protein
MRLETGIGFAVLTNTAKRFDFASRDVVKNEIEFDQRRIALDRIESGDHRLREDEGFTHRLLAGGEIRDQWIATAGADLRIVWRRRFACYAAANREDCEALKDFLKRPVEEVNQRIWVSEGSFHRLGVQ